MAKKSGKKAKPRRQIIVSRVDMAEPIPVWIQKLKGKKRFKAYLEWHLDKISRMKQ